MFSEHTAIDTPPDDSVIWRYMDLERMVALLSSAKLHLTRVDKFKDPWEGSWPNEVIRWLETTLGPHQSQQMVSMFQRSRLSYYVNCWHESEHQSAALWDQYGPSAGLAVKTTVGALKKAVLDARQFYIGRVSYVDFSGPGPGTKLNMLDAAFLKRKSFEHEREARVLFWNSKFLDSNWKPEDQPASDGLDVDLAQLLQSVFLSPMAPKWLLPHIQKLFEKFSLPSVSVVASDLYDPRVY